MRHYTYVCKKTQIWLLPFMILEAATKLLLLFYKGYNIMKKSVEVNIFIIFISDEYIFCTMYYHRYNKNIKTDTKLIFYSKIVIHFNPYETITDGLKYNILIQGVFTVFIINVKVKPHCIIHHEKIRNDLAYFFSALSNNYWHCIPRFSSHLFPIIWVL